MRGNSFLLAGAVLGLCAAISFDIRLAAQAATPRRYVWSAQLVGVDSRAGTVTLTAAAKPHIARYIGDFKSGDRVLITWATPKPGDTDGIISVAAYDMTKKSHPDDYGYVLPVEFVSFDKSANTMTFKAHATAATLARFRVIPPGKSVKVTSPFQQYTATAAITAVVVDKEPRTKD